jgi:hypothetical protein
MVWVTNLTFKKMEKNVLCKYDGKEIYSESELLQKICDKLTYGFGTQYVDVDEINEVYGYHSTLNINSLSMRSADDDSDSEFVEIIFGEPTIEGWFADLISE